MGAVVAPVAVFVIAGAVGSGGGGAAAATVAADATATVTAATTATVIVTAAATATVTAVATTSKLHIKKFYSLAIFNKRKYLINMTISMETKFIKETISLKPYRLPLQLGAIVRIS
ncbi:hypothetical protein E2C01_045328 [Portunus trituberculatus]|uniref:Uncharacterized protein n=1 Tax=Portunus trituberculatus TaxID=210409 RepID=A0A5B7FY19_PORTR|nr:hypothetical protein [Portunus trituberculatus]